MHEKKKQKNSIQFGKETKKRPSTLLDQAEGAGENSKGPSGS